jgi:hypothetical protein
VIIQSLKKALRYMRDYGWLSTTQYRAGWEAGVHAERIANKDAWQDGFVAGQSNVWSWISSSVRRGQLVHEAGVVIQTEEDYRATYAELEDLREQVKIAPTTMLTARDLLDQIEPADRQWKEGTGWRTCTNLQYGMTRKRHPEDVRLVYSEADVLKLVGSLAAGRNGADCTAVLVESVGQDSSGLTWVRFNTTDIPAAGTVLYKVN